jgi:hypothetical protein
VMLEVDEYTRVDTFLKSVDLCSDKLCSCAMVSSLLLSLHR